MWSGTAWYSGSFGPTRSLTRRALLTLSVRPPDRHWMAMGAGVGHVFEREVFLISNRQKIVALNLPRVRGYARRLRSTLRLGRRDFNVSFVGDSEIERLNRAYRGKPQPTDVLSFPWNGRGQD